MQKACCGLAAALLRSCCGNCCSNKKNYFSTSRQCVIKFLLQQTFCLLRHFLHFVQNFSALEAELLQFTLILIKRTVVIFEQLWACFSISGVCFDGSLMNITDVFERSEMPDVLLKMPRLSLSLFSCPDAHRREGSLSGSGCARILWFSLITFEFSHLRWSTSECLSKLLDSEPNRGHREFCLKWSY